MLARQPYTARLATIMALVFIVFPNSVGAVLNSGKLCISESERVFWLLS